MSESIRIRTTPDGKDKYVKIKIEQDFNSINVLSLKISQEEAYRTFCSDYGVLIGRVFCNQGFGISNAKISVFIPVSDSDKLDPEVFGLYPYEVITDKNLNGVRYNTLPQDSDTQDTCFTPIGSFPSKREILDNDEMLDVYCKYYKFTTTTNHAGDYMIFGLAIGNYIVQVDADISDIGLISQKPYDLIGKGTSSKFFDSPTKFASGNNLDKLVQVKTLRSGVTIQPFWGSDGCEIGISRLDFDLQTQVTPSAIFMGSIFGDNEKNSINKHCRPRRDLGLMCDVITGEGTIEMIRKTFDGKIESYDVNGGRVIDGDGAWAYQVPMNLDYVTTDEYGNLIPSDDPNIGLPTRASVRFRASMDVTGDVGRLRTRASYLIPNNPSNPLNPNPADYSFDETTKDYSFRDMYWNKIYSVKSFIPRYQIDSFASTRNMTGLKGVDECGNKNPAPYNRINTEINPLFNVLCIIITIITNLVALINASMISSVNVMIYILNETVLNAICNVLSGFAKLICPVLHFLKPSLNKCNCEAKMCIGQLSGDGCSLCTCSSVLPYIPCITITCDEQVYAPGCVKGLPLGASKGWDTANNSTHIDNWQFDGKSGHDAPDAGLSSCFAIQLAISLRIFQLDFYNDWINGSLFAFLLKYKKRKHGTEKFCEYDCADFGGGVDGNNDGSPDNQCRTSYLLDPKDCSRFSPNTFTIKEGLIKKVGDIFYYASQTHGGEKLLFATDIIHLGSIFDCDWQGIPKIQQLLVPTTYKIAPDTSEYDPVTNIKEVCGLTSTGFNIGSTDGIFFAINCLGLDVDARQCTNIRKQCEFGVDLDSEDDTVTPPTSADCSIGPDEIEDTSRYFRDVFFNLNNYGINIPIYTPAVRTSDFTDSTSVNNTPILGSSGSDYNLFRAYDGISDSSYVQPRGNSYFFYFGITPGKTAIEKMNSSFFTPCSVVTKENFFIDGTVIDVTTINGSNGSIAISIVGNAVSPFTYSWSGPIGFTSTSQNLTGLVAGSYTVVVTDHNGLQATATFNVGGPIPLFCNVNVNKNASLSTNSDGQIIINGVGGGIGPYFYQVVGPTPTAYGSSSPSYNSYIISGLSIGVYTVNIKDSSTTPFICSTTGLTINAPAAMAVSVSKTDSGCAGLTNGTLSVSIVGGVAPYSVTTVTSPGSSYNSILLNQTNLAGGTYVTTVTDSIGQTTTITKTIAQDLALSSNHTIPTQCDPSNTYINITFTDPNTTGPWSITCQVDGVGRSITPTTTSSNSFSAIIGGAEATSGYDIAITNPHSCTQTESIGVSEAPRPTSSLGGSITVGSSSGGNTPLTATSTGGWGGYTYIWSNAATSSSITVPTGSGTYTLLITDSKGCTFTTAPVTV